MLHESLCKIAALEPRSNSPLSLLCVWWGRQSHDFLPKHVIQKQNFLKFSLCCPKALHLQHCVCLNHGYKLTLIPLLNAL